MTPTDTVRPIRRALISVYDKTGLDELARGLADEGVEIVSSGGSAAHLREIGVPVTAVEEVTGFPECLDGRVKTLHPAIHAGILADRTRADHSAQLEDLGVAGFDLVVVNLYPFAETVASGADRAAIIEKIDIGGPSMVRGAAKNHASVAVVVDPTSYPQVLDAVRAGGLDLATRVQLATRAFAHTAAYDVAVSTWMAEQGTVGAAPDASVESDATGGDRPAPAFAADRSAAWELAETLRYGENPHQAAALYREPQAGERVAPGVASAVQLHGKAMSYNNYVDADAAWRAAHDHGDQPTVAVVKHANPCGIAVGPDIATAHERAHACDPVSAFGGIIAANREVTEEMASTVAGIFTEVVIAPSFAPAAVELLTAKKNIRLLTAVAPQRQGLELRPISGGLLVQQRDVLDAPGDVARAWEHVSGEPADEATLADLQFAWRAVRATKSNAILLAKDGASVGIGMGQVNRVDSCHLAVSRAGRERARGAVAASDAFFPFADGLQVLLDAGVRAVVQPGGSMRDEEVVTAAREAGVTMYLTGTRHFAH
ncbi:bifunctional phosphoribosylaminoimidazolecarboxamide formyltransferase/IMP cyclohydrolase [Kytococcus sedentarius]|uniref:Bifunctional purine biosynthesis protein PurH n=1 Tax=Kytococcus sedentarius (strain ATCC 14392 / DSM 20547 / JCM 11482 / CCUG 33030 / NBRC 15357 / NCTC 11040 / CCM 314 / 541) TaxID=478801 RepID=C7NF13_KYTSD|nr:bifunctional phosphoribosylaminoimidazolecarboxamide formyltransferase/IMP cyclohydrolase [Kytococcus sedentarius]ACV05837.1 IMP cyclohydrolase /phosphoribosylaminoimidazolecarboxamide formyltransferase [Kytococcus sedentarius DSM 20547]QQB64240.1 bifunctional phosphoribosylaminoimidazolecarboxamide formyltransferase/IMP cyclohydrolase [Kytococcus sedentarius]STX12749.1 Bifunctional purine biosynthesis protein PurH [Kytococcus sedentarius]